MPIMITVNPTHTQTHTHILLSGLLLKMHLNFSCFTEQFFCLMHQPAISLERVTVLLNVKREEDGKQATNKAQKVELNDIHFTSALVMYELMLKKGRVYLKLTFTLASIFQVSLNLIQANLQVCKFSLVLAIKWCFRVHKAGPPLTPKSHRG